MAKGIETWKIKRWYDVIAPKEFNYSLIGQTLASDPSYLVGRNVKASLGDMAGNAAAGNVQVEFKIFDVRGGKAHTKYIGHETPSGYLRRLVRRSKSRIDVVVDVTSKDGVRLRIKPVVVMNGKLNATQTSSIRKVLVEKINGLSEMPFNKIIDAIVFRKNIDDITAMIKKISPTKKVEIRKVEVLGEVPVPDINEVEKDMRAIPTSTAAQPVEVKVVEEAPKAAEEKPKETAKKEDEQPKVEGAEKKEKKGKKGESDTEE